MRCSVQSLGTLPFLRERQHEFLLIVLHPQQICSTMRARESEVMQ
jgi:hypothetical protein